MNGYEILGHFVEWFFLIIGVAATITAFTFVFSKL